jgi:ureidoglycolate hydrolase
METRMLVYAQALTPAAFEPFGHVIEPRRTGEQFDRSNPYVPGAGHGHVPLVLTNGEPVLRIMHQRLRGLRFGKMARHMRVSQCLGAIGGKDWYLGVVAPDETVAPDRVAAFHIPGDRIVKLHVGTWHAGPHFTHEEAMFLNLENSDTNSRDFDEAALPEECIITPRA